MQVTAYTGTSLLLPKKKTLKVIDENIDIKWPPLKNNTLEVRWDAEITGNNIFFRVAPRTRVTDIRVFYATLSIVFTELKPLLNRLRLRDKTLFPTYHSLLSFLESLSLMSEFILSKYTDSEITKIPPYKLATIQSYTLVDITNLTYEKRIATVINELEKRIWTLISFISKTHRVFPILEIYIPYLTEFEKKWLKEIKKILSKLENKDIAIFLCYPDEESIEILKSVIPLKVLTPGLADFYRSVLTMAFLTKNKRISLFDFVHFKYGYHAYQEISVTVVRRLNQLVEVGLLNKISDDEYEILD